MDEIEKNVRLQLLPSMTGKNHITYDDRSFFALAPRLGGLDLLSNTEFPTNYEYSRTICDPLDNSDPETTETKQILITRNIKTERQNITLSKKLMLWKIAHQK